LINVWTKVSPVSNVRYNLINPPQLVTTTASQPTIVSKRAFGYRYFL